jgi:NAD(P)-dependent dehydrogenase (short-subunit alcohol dehydrogenase family)
MPLESFPHNFRALVFGAGGGMGAALVSALCADPRCGAVYAAARRAPDASGTAVGGTSPDEAGVGRPSRAPWPLRFDLTDEASIAAAVAEAAADGPLHLVLVATGVLHAAALRPERTWRSLSAASMTEAFAINTIGPALVAKHALPRLASGEKAVLGFLSARVGSIEDNRLGGWHSYRASKAALNMVMRTLAVELAQRNKTAACVSLHPGTVDTALSRPFQASVAPGRLFSPAQSAGYLLAVIDGLTPAQSGRFFAWDGAEIPF